MKTTTRSLTPLMAILAIVIAGALGACNTNDPTNPSLSFADGGSFDDDTMGDDGSTDGDGDTSDGGDAGNTNTDGDTSDGGDAGNTNTDDDAGNTNTDGDAGNTNTDGDAGNTNTDDDAGDTGTDGDAGDTGTDGDAGDTGTDGGISCTPVFTITFTSGGGGWTRVHYVKGGSSTIQQFDLVDDSQDITICSGEESGTRFIITRMDPSPPAPVISVTTSPQTNFYVYFDNVGSLGTDPNLIPGANPGMYVQAQGINPSLLNMDYFILTALP